MKGRLYLYYSIMSKVRAGAGAEAHCPGTVRYHQIILDPIRDAEYGTWNCYLLPHFDRVGKEGGLARIAILYGGRLSRWVTRNDLQHSAIL